jgi:SLT domain-containing protein
MIGGTKFEAAHTGTKMRVGSSATDPRSFPNKYYLGDAGFSIDPLIQKILSLGPAKYFKKAWDAIHKIPHPGTNDKKYANLPWHAASGFLSAGQKAIFSGANRVKQLALAALAKIGGAFSKFFKGGGNVSKWLAEAMRIDHTPANWAGPLAKIISKESGGNPNAVNRTDSNARAGHPSQGLMQLIPSNFRTYHAPGTSWNILDPVANIAAAIRYIMVRYGSVFNTPWMRGTGTYYNQGGLVKKYDQGGVLSPGYTTVYNGTGKPEAVFTPEQLSALSHCQVNVFLDGVDITNRTHVEVSNQALIRALNKRGGHRP